MNKEQVKKREKNQDIEGAKPVLILLNDDFHTFEYVIESLVKICKHSPEQAEQCAMITHFKGKCEISKGKFEKLKAQRKKLTERGLKTIIE
ncbi:MAG: ATP-dependent Clp protease adaptor ClpS [Bacteroidales bacterium]|nr:ATP-dependent Clp protease adaptor ClpS [Bacteroidales bacterium]